MHKNGKIVYCTNTQRSERKSSRNSFTLNQVESSKKIFIACRAHNITLTPEQFSFPAKEDGFFYSIFHWIVDVQTITSLNLLPTHIFMVDIFGRREAVEGGGNNYSGKRKRDSIFFTHLLYIVEYIFFPIF